jgi:hypothetical protein
MLRKLLIPITLFVILFTGAAQAAGTPPGRSAIRKPGVYSIDYLRPSTQLDPAVFPVDGQIGFWLWSELNPQQGQYDWQPGGAGILEAWVRKQVRVGLRPAVMISTYDATTANDIRSTPNWVIKLPDAVLPVTMTNGLPHYIDYFRRRTTHDLNGEFNRETRYWTVSDPSAITVTESSPADDYVPAKPTHPDRPGKAPALRLGGANGIDASIVHDPEPIPAMPAILAGQRTAYVTARVNIDTIDAAPRDHLYLDVLDETGNLLGGTAIDNTAHAGKAGTYWQVLEVDVSARAPERNIQVRLRVTTDGAAPTTFYVDNVQVRVRHLIPKYWTDPYLSAYKGFIDAFGSRYKQTPPGGDPRYDLEFVAIGTGVYGESQPTQDVAEWEYGTTFDHVVKEAGLDTSEKWRVFVNDVTASYAKAFSGRDGVPLKPLLLQYAPSYLNPEEKGYTAEFAVSRHVGLSYNRLIPEWTQVYRNNKGGGYDPIRLYWPQVATAFEGSSSDIKCSPVLSYWAIAGSVARHTDYLRLDSWMLGNDDGTRTVHAQFADWARQYLGKGVEETPRVWTMMREQRNPFMLRCGLTYYDTPSLGSPWAEYGNFNFFLMQDDTIAGGRTVAETNDKGADRRYARDPSTGAAHSYAGLGNCPPKPYSNIFAANPPVCSPEPYNPNLPPLVGQNPNNYKDFYYPYDWTGDGKEAYSVRRTDQAMGNPFMFFRVDDGYVKPGQTVKAKITVGYFDIGTDAWSLKYQSTGGEKVAGTVTKAGTKKYRRVTFALSDARFANGLAGGADFYLDSLGDGDEWLHIVEVERTDPPLPPTQTPAPTGSATATETPSPTASATQTETPPPTATLTATGTPSATRALIGVFLPLILAGRE